jgi:hypothetical protein
MNPQRGVSVSCDQADGDTVLSVVANIAGTGVQPSLRMVRAKAGMNKNRVADALNRLVLDKRLTERRGPRRSPTVHRGRWPVAVNGHRDRGWRPSPGEGPRSAQSHHRGPATVSHGQPHSRERSDRIPPHSSTGTPAAATHGKPGDGQVPSSAG